MGFASFIPIIGPAVEKLLSLIPDPNERARAEAEYQKALLDATVKEAADNRAINQAEAQHSSIFVAGWRPFIGWVCGFAVAFQYLIRPFWVWFVEVYTPGAPVPPTLDDSLWQLMFGMLGIGGLRTIEKLKGKTR